MKPLTSKQLVKIKSFPEYTGICPTCDGDESYNLDGRTYECDCGEQLRLQRRFFAANIGSLYHTISFDDFFDSSGELKDTVMNYIQYFADNLYYGRGITFSGPLGTGKSFGATVVLKELIKKGYSGYFITFDDLLNIQSMGWREIGSPDEFYMIRDAQILIIDELFGGLTQKQKELLADTLERIVRYRVSNKMPTIITTNLTSEQEEMTYPRVHSLLATSQIRCQVEGNDVRKDRVRELTSARIDRGDRKPII